MHGRKRGQSSSRRGGVRSGARGRGRGQRKTSGSKSSGKSSAKRKDGQRQGGAVIDQAVRPGAAGARARRRGRGRRPALITSRRSSIKSAKSKKDEVLAAEGAITAAHTAPSILGEMYLSSEEEATEVLYEPLMPKEDAIPKTTADVEEERVNVDKKDQAVNPSFKDRTDHRKKKATRIQPKKEVSVDKKDKPVNPSFKGSTDHEKKKAKRFRTGKRLKVHKMDRAVNTSFMDSWSDEEAVQPKRATEEWKEIPSYSYIFSAQKPVTKMSARAEPEGTAAGVEEAERKYKKAMDLKKRGDDDSQGRAERKCPTCHSALDLPEFPSSRNTEEDDGRRMKKTHSKRARDKHPFFGRGSEESLRQRHDTEDDSCKDLAGTSPATGPSYVEEITEELFEPDVADWNFGTRTPMRLVRRTHAVRHSLDPAADRVCSLARPSSSKRWRRCSESSSLEEEGGKGSRVSLESDFRSLGRGTNSTLSDSQWASHAADGVLICKQQSTRRSENNPRSVADETYYEERAHPSLQNEEWPPVWKRREDGGGGFYVGGAVIPVTVVASGTSQPYVESKPQGQRYREVHFERNHPGAVNHKPFIRTQPLARFRHPVICQLCSCPDCCGNCCNGTFPVGTRLSEPFPARKEIEDEERFNEEEMRRKERALMHQNMVAGRLEREERLRNQKLLQLEHEMAMEDRVRQMERMRMQEQIRQQQRFRDAPRLDERIERDLAVQTLAAEAAKQRLMRELVEEELHARTKSSPVITAHGRMSSGIQQNDHSDWKQQRRVADIPRWSKRRCSYTALQENENRVAQKRNISRPPKSLSVVKQNQKINRKDSRKGTKKGSKKDSERESILRSLQDFQDDSSDRSDEYKDYAESLDMASLGEDSTREKEGTEMFVWISPPLAAVTENPISKKVSYTKRSHHKHQERKLSTPSKVKIQEPTRNLSKVVAQSTVSDDETEKDDVKHAFSQLVEDHRESTGALFLRQVYKSQTGAPGKKSISIEISTVLQRTLPGEHPVQTREDAFQKEWEPSTTTLTKKRLKSEKTRSEEQSRLFTRSMSDRAVMALSATKIQPKRSSRSSIKPYDEARRSSKTSEAFASRQFHTAGLPSDSQTEFTNLLESDPLGLRSESEMKSVYFGRIEESSTREPVESLFTEQTKTDALMSQIKSGETGEVEKSPMTSPLDSILPLKEEAQAPQIPEITADSKEQEDAEKFMEILGTYNELFPESKMVAIIGFVCAVWIILVLVTSSVMHKVPSSTTKSPTVTLNTTQPSKATGLLDDIYYCETEQCLREGSYLNSLLDEDKAPCDDFYEHVCGRWPHSVVSPTSEIGRAVTASVLLQESLETPLIEYLQDPTNTLTVAPAAYLFETCMNRSSVQDYANVYARNVFAEWTIRVWPVPTYRVNLNHVDAWRFAGELVRDLGAGFLARVSVAIDPINDRKSVLCLDDPMPLYFPSDTLQHNFTSVFKATLRQVAREFMANGTDTDRQMFSDEVFSVLKRLDKISSASLLSTKKTRVVVVSSLYIGFWELLAMAYLNNPNFTRTARVLLNSNFVEQDLPAAVNAIDPRALVNYLGFRALIWLAPFMPSSLPDLQRLFLLESSGRMELPTPHRLCLRAVERSTPACLLKALVLPLQVSGVSLWHRHWLSQVESAFLRSVSRAAWLDELSTLMIRYRLKHTRVDAFYPVDLIHGNASCATGYKNVPGRRAGPLYSHLLKIRQQEILQEVPGALGYRLSQALDTEPVFSLPEQVVRVPVGLINMSVSVNSTLFTFHLARVAVRLIAAMTPLLYESSVYEREIAFQFTDDSERRLEELMDCLLADWRRLRIAFRQPSMGLIPGASETTLLGRWLLEQAGAVKLTFQAFRELLHVNRIWLVDFRYANLRQLSASQLFFVYYALDQCEHSDVAFQRRQFLLRGQPSARMRVNLPLRHVPAFAEAFECNQGDNLRPSAGGVCHSLRR